ncbi:MAG: hypothetical protein WAO20_20120, partial [Acidobacteriota bacterium]
KDSWPGAGSGVPTYPADKFVVAGSWVYYRGTDGIGGLELWRSDGSSGGAELVGDVNPAGDSMASPLAAAGGWLFFAADDGVHGLELWRTDGSTTQLVRDAIPGPQGSFGTGTSSSSYLSVGLDDRIVYEGASLDSGGEPWVSNGTESGTFMLSDINQFTQGATVQWLQDRGDTLLFGAYSGDTGQELWHSDGTEGGTSLLADLVPGVESSSPITNLATSNGKTFFRARTPATGFEIWMTDGTADGSHLVADLTPGPSSTTIETVGAAAGRLFFLRSTSAEGKELWISDGTEVGTHIVRDICPGVCPGVATPEQATVLPTGVAVFFAATDSGSPGLWRSDGTEGGTLQLLSPDTFADGGTGARFAVAGGAAYCVILDVHGRELWRTDGSEDGTRLVRDICPGPCSMGGMSSIWMKPFGEQLLLRADDGSGPQLWISDGSEAGTRPLGPAGGSGRVNAPGRPLVQGPVAYVPSVGDSADVFEIWVTDGTDEGTIRKVAQIPAGSGGIPAPVAAWDGEVLMLSGKTFWMSRGFTAEPIWTHTFDRVDQVE